MRVVYLCHPVRGDVENNLAKAKRLVRALEERCPGVAIVATWITECEVWDESNPVHREQGIQRDLAVLERCDEVWLCGPSVSPGMQREWDHAIENKIPVCNMTGDSKDVGL